MNLARQISETARKYPDKPAVIFEGTVYTFGDIDRQVEEYTAMLEAMRVRSGDRVALQLSKRMEFIFLHLAIMSMGAVSLPLNPDYKPEEINYFLTDSGSTVLFAERATYSRAKAALGGIRGMRTVLVDADEVGEASSFAREINRAESGFVREFRTREDDVAMICYTSGTTGKSKGATITHRNLISNMMDLKKIWHWTDRDVLLHVLPLFHVHGLAVALHGSLNAGSTLIMLEKFDPARTWEMIETEKCTMLMGVPTMYQRLTDQWDRMDDKPDLKAMRVFISGSAPLSENQFRCFEQQTGFRILERYGMTETGMITSNPYDPIGRKAQSVGYPLPSVRIRVVDEHGKDVVPGEVGEVLIQGDNVFKGYHGMPDKTRESFGEGWFRSGDLGYRDPEDNNRLYLVGRTKELIITGGYNVYPKEIENLLETHEAVKESAVIGLQDKDLGERVAAIVALRVRDTTETSDSLIDYCKQHIASYKCPKLVLFVDRLPRNAMGKVQKNRLMEQYQLPS